jgi:predicted outer membrane repeat protein
MQAVAGGTIYLTSALPVIGRNVVIDGPDTVNVTIQRVEDPANEFRFFTSLGNGPLEFNDLNLVNGAADEGGAVYYSPTTGATLTIEGCRFELNEADNGGAIYSHYGTVITDTTFLGNYASDSGGGIYFINAIGGAQPLTLIDCTLSDNWAENDGGGIYHYSTGPLTITTTEYGFSEYDYNMAFHGNGGFVWSMIGDVDITGGLNAICHENRAMEGVGSIIYAEYKEHVVVDIDTFRNFSYGLGPDIYVQSRPTGCTLILGPYVSDSHFITTPGVAIEL